MQHDLFKQLNAECTSVSVFSIQTGHTWLNVIDSEIGREPGDAFEGTEGIVIRRGQSLLGFLA